MIMIFVRKTIIVDSIKYLLFLGIIITILAVSSANMNYNWQWYRVPGYIISHSADGSFMPGRLLTGLALTVKISVISLFLAFFIGMITALFRLSSSIAARLVARIYLELIRNTPLLIQLFVIYFVISPVFGISPATSRGAA